MEPLQKLHIKQANTCALVSQAKPALKQKDAFLAHSSHALEFCPSVGLLYLAGNSKQIDFEGAALRHSMTLNMDIHSHVGRQSYGQIFRVIQ